jgi:hypothetical protein
MMHMIMRPTPPTTPPAIAPTFVPPPELPPPVELLKKKTINEFSKEKRDGKKERTPH